MWKKCKRVSSQFLALMVSFMLLLSMVPSTVFADTTVPEPRNKTEYNATYDLKNISKAASVLPSVTSGAAIILGEDYTYTKSTGIVDIPLVEGDVHIAAEAVSNETVKFLGTGTKSDPYLITNKKELIALSQQINSGDLETNTDTYFKQTDNIDLTGTEWIPIGTSAKPFMGNFDGGGFSISNLNARSMESYVGLFGYVENSYPGFFNNTPYLIIRNVNLIDPQIVSENNDGEINVGAIAGYISYANIFNCSVQGGHIEQKGSESAYVGALFGVTNVKLDCSMIACYSSSEVKSDQGYAAGLIGNVNAMPLGGLKLSDCYSTGDIEGCIGAGGLVAFRAEGGAQMTIKNSFASGSVKASNGFSGGILGIDGTVEGCIAINKVIGSASSEIGRVLASGTAKNNKALNSILVNSALLEGALNDKNGFNVSMTDLKKKETWESIGFNFSSKWEWNEEGKYPKLAQMSGQNASPYSVVNSLPLSIKVQPVNVTLFKGETATFSISAAGDADTMVYEWQASTDRNVWSKIEGADKSSYSIEADSTSITKQYRCVVSDKTGSISCEPVKITLVFGGSEGTKDSPYQVENAEDLKLIAKYVGADVNNGRNTFKGKYFVQNKDIDLGCDKNNPWLPIGMSVQFEGNYDGQSHKIKNLVIVDGKISGNAALFGRIKGASICNLHIVDPYVVSSNATNMAAIVADAVDANLSGCSVIGGIIWNKSEYGYTGTIVGGFQFNDVGHYTIQKCYSDTVVFSSAFAGGIIGSPRSSKADCYLTIKDSYSAGSVSSFEGYAGGSSVGVSNAGGIAGELNADRVTIENCYSVSPVSGANYLGGLAGASGEKGTIKNSVAANKMLAHLTEASKQGFTGRVLGEGSLLEKNFALNTMKVNGKEVSGGAENDKDGLGKTIAELKMQSTWSDLGFDLSGGVWEWDEKQFPKLKNMPSPSDNPLDREGNPIFILKITEQPKRKIAAQGDTVEFSVRVSGTDPLYQWQVSQKGSAWTDIEGANSNVYRIYNVASFQNESRYRCIIKDSFENSLTTQEVFLTVEGEYNNAKEAESLFNYYKKKGVLNTVKEPISIYSYTKSLENFKTEINYRGGYVGRETESDFEPTGEGLAALDWMAQEGNPRIYLSNAAGGSNGEETIDLIDTILDYQDESSGKISGTNFGNSWTKHIIQMITLEAFFEGKNYGNEKEGTKLGRSGAIEYLLNGIDSEEVFKEPIDSKEEYDESSMLFQSKTILLLSRLSNDKVYGDRAKAAMQKLLLNLEKGFDAKEGYFSDVNFISTYISALVASNHVLTEESELHENLEKIYKLFDVLRYAKVETGGYSSKVNYIDGSSDLNNKATSAVMMAYGDFINGRSIYTSITDMSNVTLTPKEIVTRDREALNIVSETKTDLQLPLMGKYGSSVKWASKNTKAITEEGKVTRLGKDVSVVLTAILSKDNYSDTKTFTVLVPANRDPHMDHVLEDIASIHLPAEVINDIDLPLLGSQGSVLTWKTNNEAVISNTGKVVRPQGGESNVAVIMTVTAQNGNASIEKSFEILVYAKNEKDKVSEGYYAVREYFLKNKNLSSSYWEVMAAYSVLGDYVSEENGYTFYDVTRHKQYDTWLATDYGAVVIQLLIMGENPYNYKGKNYVEGLLSSGGGFGSPIWKTMALQAVGEDYLHKGAMRYCKSELDDLVYGPDLAAWAMIPIATHLQQHPDDQEYKTAILSMLDKFNNNLLNGNDISVGCVASGFMAMVGAGYDEFDLRKPSMLLNGVNVVDRIFDNNFKDGATFSSFNIQLALELGDLYYGDSVWRRVAITKEDLANIIKTAKNTDYSKYTSESAENLKKALKTAEAVADSEIYGKEYFTLRDALKNLVESGNVTVEVMGNGDEPLIIGATKIKNVSSESVISDILKKVMDDALIQYEINSDKIISVKNLKISDHSAWFLYKNGKPTELSETLKEGDFVTLKYSGDVAGLKNKYGASFDLEEHLLYDDLKNLVIEGNLSKVTQNLNLKSSGIFGSKITWESSNKAIIGNNGSVNRLSSNIQVKLKAMVTIGSKTESKEFTIVVLGTSVTDPEPKQIKVHLTLAGVPKHGESGQKYVYAKNPGDFQLWVPRTAYTFNSKSVSVYEVFMRGLEEYKLDQKGAEDNYVSKIKGPDGTWLGEFDNGSYSGWMYTINGKHPSGGLLHDTLKNGDSLVWHYTDDYTQEEGSEKWHNKPYVPETEKGSEAMVRIDSTAKIDSSGRAKVALTEKEIKSALDKALEAAKKAGKKNVKPEVQLDIKADNQATAIETSVPTSSVKELTKAEAVLSINTPMGNLVLTNKMLEEIGKAAAGKEVTFQITKIDKAAVSDGKTEALNEAQKKAAGEHTVYEVSILSGDKKITSFGSKKLSLSLPYTLKTGEKAVGVGAWYLDDAGQLTKLTSSYDEKKKLVTFETDHLSCFIVGHEVTADALSGFTDVKKGQWYYESIMYLVDQGILSGTTKNTFSPNANITRAEFAQILYGMAKSQAGTSGSAITADSVKADGSGASKAFVDVKSTAWYAKAVEWAYANGVVKGTQAADGKMSFSPSAKISRQDMSVMIQNYIQKVEKKAITEKNAAISFADDTVISSYAKEAVASMQKGGVVSGIKAADGRYTFAPKANATRAEAATMIAKYLKK